MPSTLWNRMWDYAGEMFWSRRRKTNFTGVSAHTYTTFVKLGLFMDSIEMHGASPTSSFKFILHLSWIRPLSLCIRRCWLIFLSISLFKYTDGGFGAWIYFQKTPLKGSNVPKVEFQPYSAEKWFLLMYFLNSHAQVQWGCTALSQQ